MFDIQALDPWFTILTDQLTLDSNTVNVVRRSLKQLVRLYFSIRDNSRNPTEEIVDQVIHFVVGMLDWASSGKEDLQAELDALSRSNESPEIIAKIE